MYCTLSGLNKQAIDQVQSLENELGHRLLAFSCHDIQPASLGDETLYKIKDLEEKLGIVLLAVQNAD